MFYKLKVFLNEYFWKISNAVGYDLKQLGIDHSVSFANAGPHISVGSTASIFHASNTAVLNGFFCQLNRKVVIEPSRSYAITGLNKIIGQSIYAYEVKPSVGTYLKYRFLRRGNIIAVPQALLFDGSIGTNYFYFFSEVISKLWVLEKAGIDKSVPVIIGKKVFDTRYFKYLYRHTAVGTWNWLVQNENDFIECNSIFIIQPAPYNLDYWQKTLSLTAHLNSPVKPFRRLFLTRPGQLGRRLSNEDEIMPLLMQNGFEVTDPGSLSFEKQVKLFSETEMIVAVHGAAITNMMFAPPASLRILEIIPEGRITAQTYWLAAMFNVKYYDVILGTRLEGLTFAIAPDSFKNAINRLLVFQ